MASEDPSATSVEEPCATACEESCTNEREESCTNVCKESCTNACEESCATACEESRARSRVRVSAKMWSCTIDLRCWSTGSEDCNAMRRQSECLSSHLHFVCVVETPHVLKQGVHKLHCWFTEPDVNLLLTREHFLLPTKKLMDSTRLFVSAVRSLWCFSWFVFEKSCCVVKLNRRRQFLGEV